MMGEKTITKQLKHKSTTFPTEQEGENLLYAITKENTFIKNNNTNSVIIFPLSYTNSAKLKTTVTNRLVSSVLVL